MRVNVADIKLELGSHKRVPVQVTVEPVDLAGQTVRFDQPFVGEAEVWNIGERLLVKASLSGEAVLPCSRCLTTFSLPLKSTFEEEFVEGQPGTGVEEDEADRPVSYFTGDEIDLSEPLRDHVLLELPMKPLCKKSCQGLCSQCGSDLNLGPCSCVETTTVDPRFAALQQLLRKPDSNS